MPTEAASISIFGRSLQQLAQRFPAKAPPSVERAFYHALRALGLLTCPSNKYRLVYIPSTAVRWAARYPTVPGASLVKIDMCGSCEEKTAYVVHSDIGGRASECATAIHEVLHFVFGPHPWPHEKSRAREAEDCACEWDKSGHCSGPVKYVRAKGVRRE